MPCLCADATVRHGMRRRVCQLRVIASSRRRDTLPRSGQKDARGATAKVARLVAAAAAAGRHGARCRSETRGTADLDSRCGPRDRHARRGTHRQQHGSVPPIHRRGVCLCFLAAFGMRSGQLTMRSSRSASATSSSHAPTRPRTEIPAWCTVSGSPETSGCHQ